MNNIKIQEQQHSIKKLRSLLGQAFDPVAEKDDTEWEKHEQAIFARLDSQSSRGIVLERATMFRSYTRPLIAVAALLVLAINAYIAFQTDFFTPSHQLHASSVLDISGDVSITHEAGTVSLPDAAHDGIKIAAGQQYETGSDGAMMVQLVNGTGFRLSQNSRLEIVKAGPRSIHLMLHYGDILFSVRKLDNNSEFIVYTPNAECSVLGTIFGVTVRPSERTEDTRTDLAVFQGTVRIEDRLTKNTAPSVTSGLMVSLRNHAFSATADAPGGTAAIRDISLLKTALELSSDQHALPSGIVEFNSQPSPARVIINDQVMGTTPMVLRYPEGSYTVTITREDFEPWTGSFEVTKLHASSISATLEESRAAPESKRRRIARRGKKPPSQLQPGEYVNRPEYVEALIQMTVGEYRKAIALLDSLMATIELSARDKMLVMRKISHCYQSLGDFRKTIRRMERHYKKETDPITKANLLWEIANVKANCLGDFIGAQYSLRQYIKNYPDGPWVQEARRKLAELSVLQAQLSN